MARIRTLKPEWWASESNGRLSRDARLLFAGVICHADDEGRLRASTRGLLRDVFPFDDDAPGKIDRWIAELERERKFHRYSQDGNVYGWIPNFTTHQRIDRPKPSTIPPPGIDDRSTIDPRSISVGLDGIGSEGNGREGSADAPPAKQRIRKSVLEQAGIVGDCARLWSEAYATTEAPKPIPEWGGEAARLVALAKEHGEDAIRRRFGLFVADPDPWLVERRHPLGIFVGKQHARWCVELRHRSQTPKTHAPSACGCGGKLSPVGKGRLRCGSCGIYAEVARAHA